MIGSENDKKTCSISITSKISPNFTKGYDLAILKHTQLKFSVVVNGSFQTLKMDAKAKN